MHVISTDRRRALWLGLAGLTALVAALAALALSGGGAQAASSQEHAMGSMSAMGSSATGPITQSQLVFRQDMRKLWEDHITWTRMVIVDFAAALPDLTFAEQRLLRNQADIGNAIKPYYGAAAGNALTKLLRTHILEAVPVLTYAKSGDQAKLKAALTAWYANGNQIAAFLTKANPNAWPLSMTRTMMKSHLDLTTKEAVARLRGKWTADIAAYDAVHREILGMADMLSTGILQQFPQRFS